MPNFAGAEARNEVVPAVGTWSGLRLVTEGCAVLRWELGWASGSSAGRRELCAFLWWVAREVRTLFHGGAWLGLRLAYKQKGSFAWFWDRNFVGAETTERREPRVILQGNFVGAEVEKWNGVMRCCDGNLVGAERMEPVVLVMGNLVGPQAQRLKLVEPFVISKGNLVGAEGRRGKGTRRCSEGELWEKEALL